MTIDPRFGLWLSVGLAMIGALAGLSTQLTTIFGPGTANTITAVAFIIMTLGNAVNAVLHAIPSKPGATDEFPLGPKGPPPK